MESNGTLEFLVKASSPKPNFSHWKCPYNKNNLNNFVTEREVDAIRVQCSKENDLIIPSHLFRQAISNHCWKDFKTGEHYFWVKKTDFSILTTTEIPIRGIGTLEQKNPDQSKPKQETYDRMADVYGRHFFTAFSAYNSIEPKDEVALTSNYHSELPFTGFFDDSYTDINRYMRYFSIAYDHRSPKINSNGDVPCRSNKQYYEFQKAAIKFIHERNAVLLADDMGLGKTITVIGAINLDERLKKILIICPLSVKNVWKKELAGWQVRNLTVGEAEPDYCPARRFDIFIINYDIVHKYADVLRKIEWDLIVLDEAHYIKSRQALRTRSIVGFFDRRVRQWTTEPIPARKKVLLTGTPIMNRPAELWPLVNYLDKNNFGKYDDFVSNYCDANPDHLDDDQEPRGHCNLDELNRLLKSTVMIRRRKEEVLTELPPKSRVILEVPATTQSQIEALKNFQTAWETSDHATNIETLEYRCRLAIETKNDNEYALAVQKLNSAYSVAFFEMSRVRHQIGLHKVPLVVNHLNELLESDQKVVVFAHHKDVIQKIKNNFPESVSITGDTPVNDRARIVERFQRDPNVRLFLGNLKAAGTGITLNASSTAVFAELDWVPANLSQAEDRLHRIGQLNSVLVYHIVFERSLDAKMARTIVEKQEIARRALD